jgi:hypothetical protein
MAHTYYGSDGLILTATQKENFPSGLQRIDCTFRCRTTMANNLAPLLTEGNRMPEFEAYIIRQNPTRFAGQDGFTTFTTSAFAETLSTELNTTTIFGANVGDLVINYTVETLDVPSNVTTKEVTVYTFKVLSDTITRTFTISPNVSVLTLETPPETISHKVLSETPGGFYNTTKYSVSEFIGSTAQIINVNRQSFGGVDEVQVTWGLLLTEQLISEMIFTY